MENNVISSNNSNTIDAAVRSSVRYMLVHKMMEENFTKWIAQQSTMNLVQKLIDDCKKKNINLSTPSPIFMTKVNPLNQSQSLNHLNQHFMPPVSPNSAALINYQNEKRNMMTESQVYNDDRRKLSESLTSSMILSSSHKSKIPQFYFPNGNISPETIELEDAFLNKIFTIDKDEITMEEFLPITTEFLNFPKMFNSVLFKKIDTESKGKISRSAYVEFHSKNFRGTNETKKFFNLIKSPDKKDIYRSDFMPFMRALLEQHPGLAFLQAHPTFQEKYSETVIMRIFYTCDLNDDGKITFREFKKSNVVQIFKKVCEEPDINLVREYFSYEHFYVIYCIFWDLDSSESENEFFLDKEDFSKYDGHSLSRKAVERIFAQIPRKFKSTVPDKMGFEDFLWYLLSEEDKTTRTSIEYWFKVVDLDDNGIITPHEMKFFYDEQVHRMEYLQHETVIFEDIVCQLYDMIQPEKEYQWTLKNFLANPVYASTFFNNLLNLNKFLANEQKDPFARTEIDKNPELSDWDKFACYEYQRKISEENDENPEEEGGLFDSNDEKDETCVSSSESGA